MLGLQLLTNLFQSGCIQSQWWNCQAAAKDPQKSLLLILEVTSVPTAFMQWPGWLLGNHLLSFHLPSPTLDFFGGLNQLLRLLGGPNQRTHGWQFSKGILKPATSNGLIQEDRISTALKLQDYTGPGPEFQLPPCIELPCSDSVLCNMQKLVETFWTLRERHFLALLLRASWLVMARVGLETSMWLLALPLLGNLSYPTTTDIQK